MKITKDNLKEIELYYHPKQKYERITGTELYQHLKDENLLKECLTEEDLEDIKKLGLEKFNKYFKGKYVYAWNSMLLLDGYLRVPFLVGHGGGVSLGWHWLDSRWGASDPALRFSKSLKLRNSELSDTLFLCCQRCQCHIPQTEEKKCDCPPPKPYDWKHLEGCSCSTPQEESYKK